MKLIQWGALLLFFHCCNNILFVHAKIRLLTFHCNRPDFLELQYKTLKKFLRETDDFELIVFNDATDKNLKQEIEQRCNKLGLTCICFPQELHHTGPLIEKMKPYYIDGTNASVRHCQLVQYALNNFGYRHDDIVGIIEGDVFLIKEFSIRETLKNCDIACAIQTDREDKGYEYMWIGLSFLNMPHLPHKTTLNFDLAYHNGNIFLDSGGSTYYYLQNNPNLNVKKYYRVPIVTLPRTNSVKLQQLGFSDKEISFLNMMVHYQAEHDFVSTEFHFDRHFLHYGWSRDASQVQKLRAFTYFLQNILS